MKTINDTNVPKSFYIFKVSPTALRRIAERLEQHKLDNPSLREIVYTATDDMLWVWDPNEKVAPPVKLV